VVFAHVSERERSVSGNRTEFIGRNGSLARPAAMRRKRLSGRTGAGLDPCAAIQTRIELAERAGARSCSSSARPPTPTRRGSSSSASADVARGARQALEAVWEHWNRTLGAVNVDTPDPALNVLANGWLVYQTCRAGCGDAAATTSPAAPTASATSCRTPWR
jgi:cyclic beta-1,2-glucan synthetase